MLLMVCDFLEKYHHICNGQWTVYGPIEDVSSTYKIGNVQEQLPGNSLKHLFNKKLVGGFNPSEKY